MEAADPLVIYLLDDDAGVRDGIGRLLRLSGFQVRTCASVEELLASADRETRGCVLYDLSLGIAGPRSLADRLQDRGVTLPLIALTGDFEDRTDRDARAGGAQFLFHKPIDSRALLDVISWVTNGAKAREGMRH